MSACGLRLIAIVSAVAASFRQETSFRRVDMQCGYVRRETDRQTRSVLSSSSCGSFAELTVNYDEDPNVIQRRGTKEEKAVVATRFVTITVAADVLFLPFCHL